MRPLFIGPTVYVAGPLRSTTMEGRMANIRDANETAKKILFAGGYPFCPHTMTASWHFDKEIVADEEKLVVHGWCLKWVEVCDLFYLMPGWESSPGSVVESKCARDLGKEMYTELDVLLAVIKEMRSKAL